MGGSFWSGRRFMVIIMVRGELLAVVSSGETAVSFGCLCETLK
jgi:hypothetical protein